MMVMMVTMAMMMVMMMMILNLPCLPRSRSLLFTWRCSGEIVHWTTRLDDFDHHHYSFPDHHHHIDHSDSIPDYHQCFHLLSDALQVGRDTLWIWAFICRMMMMLVMKVMMISMMISTFLRVVGFFRGAVVAVGHLDWNADHLFPGLCLVIRG